MSHTPPLQSTSGYSENSDMRYNKAVKEISKLININTSTRRQMDNLKQFCSQLEQQNQNLMRDCDNLRRDRSFFEDKSRDYESRLRILDEKLKQKAEEVNVEAAVEKVKKEYQRNIEHLEQKLNEQGHTIIHLQEILGQRQKQNQDLKNQLKKNAEEAIKQLQKVMERQKQLQVELKKQKDNGRALKDKSKLLEKTSRERRPSVQSLKHHEMDNESHCMKCARNRQRDHDVMEWSRQVDEQNIILKKKIAWLEVKNQTPESSLYTSRSNSTRTRTLSVDQYFRDGFYERLRDSQTRYKQQRLVSKKKINKMQEQKKKLKTQNQILREKLTNTSGNRNQ